MGQGGVGTLFAGARIDEAVPLAPLTTLRVGPVAPRVITCTRTEQVVTTLRQLDSEGCRPLLVLAGGSNLVIADTLADLTVVRLAAANISVDGNIVRAEAGAVWDDVVVAAIAAGREIFWRGFFELVYPRLTALFPAPCPAKFLELVR